MATYEADAGPIVVADPNERTSARLMRALAKLPLNLFLAFIALLWLMPTIGLFFTSMLSPSDYITNGWWKIFSKPSLATFENYSNVWNSHRHPDRRCGSRPRSRSAGRSCRSSPRRSPPTRSRGSTSPAATDCSCS